MDNNESVTAVVTRRIVPGRKPDYLAWVDDVKKVAGQYPGHQGTTYEIRGENNECHVVYRFDTIENLKVWEASDERAKWVAKLDGIVEGDSRIERLTGLEFLFADQMHPKAHKMALVLTIVVFVLLLVMNPPFSYLAAALPAIPEWLILLVRVILQIVLLTYVIMPPVTRGLATWLAR